MNWLKIYHEARCDAKLKSLSDAQFRVWFNLLCYASEQPFRGQIEYRAVDLLALECAGSNAPLLVETLKRLESLRCITCSTLPGATRISFLNFEKRQGFVCEKAVAMAPAPPPETVPFVPARSAEDLAVVNRAITTLAADLQTEPLALELGRQHGSAGCVLVPGWKWLRAAQKLLDPGTPQAKRKWAYYVGIVKNLTDAERDGPTAGPAAKPTPLPPEVTGTGVRKRPRGSSASGVMKGVGA